MTHYDSSDEALGDRVRRYAETGSANAPALNLSGIEEPPVRSRWATAAIAAAVVLVAAVATATITNWMAQPGIGVGPSPVATDPSASPAASVEESTGASPSTAASPSGSEEPATTPSAPDPAPSLSGDLPPPDASVPPRPPGIADGHVDDVIGVAADFGLACEVFEQSPEMGASYRLSCHTDVDGASMGVTANLWAVDYIDEVRSVVIATGAVNGDVLEPGRALALFAALAEATVGGEPGAVSFVQQHVDDSACSGQGCELITDTATITVVYGENGARQLTIGH